MDWSETSINNTDDKVQVQMDIHEPSETNTLISPLDVREKRMKDRPEALWLHFSLLHCFLFLVYAVFTVIGIYARPGLPGVASVSAANDTFSETRALGDVSLLTSIGSRVCTSANTEKAKDALLSKLGLFQDEIKSKSLPVRLEIEHGWHAGREDGQQFSSKADTAVWHYNVSNILVRLSNPSVPLASATANCVAFASHVDSVGYPSQGATNDAAAVGFGMELLRSLMYSEQGDNCYIFLFTDCELIGAVGTVAFATQHEWRHSVKAFVTYENNGILDGKQLLVRQSGPDFLTSKYFHNSKFFKANSYVQDLGTFSEDILDSFTVLSRNNKLAGLDFTNYHDRWLENTKRDRADRLGAGSLQFLGNNMLPFMQNLVNSSALNNTFTKAPNFKNGKGTFFFDFLGTGLFLSRADFLALSFGLVLLHVIALFGAGFIFYRKRFKKRILFRFVLPLSVATLAALAAFGLGISIPAAAGALLGVYNPLFWYSYPYLAFMLYSTASLFAILLVQALANAPLTAIRQTTKRNIPRFSFAGVSAALAILVVISMGLDIQLGLFVLIFGVFTLLTLIFEYSLTRNKYVRESRLAQDMLAALSLMLNLSVPSWILLTTWRDLALAVLPVMTTVQPGLLAALFGFFATLYLFPIIPVVRRAQQQKWFVGLAGVMLVILFVACSFVEPFSADHPRRVEFLEISTVQGQNISGTYWEITATDPYDLKPAAKRIRGHLNTTQQQEPQLHCTKHVCNMTLDSQDSIATAPYIQAVKGQNATKVDLKVSSFASGWQEIMIWTETKLLSYQIENTETVMNPAKHHLHFPIWTSGTGDEDAYLIRILRPEWDSFTIHLEFETPTATFFSRTLFWYAETSQNYRNILAAVDKVSDTVAVALISNRVALQDLQFSM